MMQGASFALIRRPDSNPGSSAVPSCPTSEIMQRAFDPGVRRRLMRRRFGGSECSRPRSLLARLQSADCIAQCPMSRVKAEKQAHHEDLRPGMNRVSEIPAPRLEMRCCCEHCFACPGHQLSPTKSPALGRASVRSVALMAGRTSGGRATAATGSGVDMRGAAATRGHRGRCTWRAHLRVRVHRRATATADVRLRDMRGHRGPRRRCGGEAGCFMPAGHRLLRAGEGSVRAVDMRDPSLGGLRYRERWRSSAGELRLARRGCVSVPR